MDAMAGNWEVRGGKSIRVTVLREDTETVEICPKCRGSLKTVVGKADDGEQYYRHECLMCSWASEALPGPKAPPKTWTLEM